jgi:hypothetical protein
MAETTTDHATIVKWADGHGGKPAAVRSTHRAGDTGIIRIMFPHSRRSDHESLTEISWDEFFGAFEQRQLALLYDPKGMFSKLVGRDTAERRARGEHKAAR